MALVWTGPRDDVDRWMALDDDAFLAALRERLGRDMPRLTRVGERARYPLVLSEACAQAVPFAAVVGNAAHTLHPVAGQGFNLTQIGHASRWLPELFRVRQPLFAHSRQLGLLALDLLPTARKNFARRAMGL